MIGHGYTKVECWTIANRLRLEAWEMERQIRARDRGWYHMLNWLVVLEAQARDWRKSALAAVHPACAPRAHL